MLSSVLVKLASAEPCFSEIGASSFLISSVSLLNSAKSSLNCVSSYSFAWKFTLQCYAGSSVISITYPSRLGSLRCNTNSFNLEYVSGHPFSFLYRKTASLSQCSQHLYLLLKLVQAPFWTATESTLEPALCCIAQPYFETLPSELMAQHNPS